jgi:hypothetical protein
MIWAKSRYFNKRNKGKKEEKAVTVGEADECGEG